MKIESLQQAAGRVADGSALGLSGSLLQRSPAAFCRELVRQGKKDLSLVKPSPGYDIDLLCAAGALRRARVGIVGFDQPFNTAPNYRRAVESGAVELIEHACITAASGLRAAAQNVPFMPLPAEAMTGSDIKDGPQFMDVTDPFTGAVVPAVQATPLDWAIIHVDEVDELGNARINAAPFWDELVVRAARGVIITAERLVSTEEIISAPELTSIPGIFVTSVVIAPGGARPGNFEKYYETDQPAVYRYLEQSGDRDGLMAHLEEFADRDRAGAMEGSVR